MRNPSPLLAAALIGLMAGGTAFAQPAPAPVPVGAPADAAAPPPPPPGSRPDGATPAPPPPGHLPPPPSPGAHVVLDRGTNGLVHVDVKCADRETSQDCAGLAERMFDKISGR